MKTALLFILAGIFVSTHSIAGNNPLFSGSTYPFFNSIFAPTPVMVNKAIKDTLRKKIIPIKVEVENSFTNSYFWRGFVFNKGFMDQPDISVTRGNWNVTGWSNTVLKETGNDIITPEADMFVTYKNSYNRFSYAPGVNVFFYPSNYQNIFTAELTGVFKYSAQPVGFYFSPAYDFVSNLGGLYMEYGLYREDTINNRFSVESKLLMGYGNKTFNDYYNYEAGRFPTSNELSPSYSQNSKNLQFNVAAQYRMTTKFSLKAQIIAFRNFSDGNNYSQPAVRFNESLTMIYDF